MKKNKKVEKIVLSGILIALGVVLGTFSIPVFGGKMSPIQHFINVVAAVVLGPIYAVICAFVTSCIRNMIGTGSLLAFPGSMIGALFAGLLYKKVKKVPFALIGEFIGTGIIGALVSYKVATLILGREAAIFTYVIPFSISCIGGSIMAYVFLKVSVIKKLLLDREER